MPRTLQTSDDNGWTHIIKSKKTTPPTAPTSKYQQYANLEAVEPGRIDTLHERLQYYRDKWSQSSKAKALAKIVDQFFLFEPTLTIEKIVCIALGSPSGGRPSTWKQLGCLMDLRARYFPTAEVVFQDPVFSETDRLFFRELDISVVDSPNAFEEIHGQTFLFAPHCEHEQFCEALDGRKLPGLCVTNDAQQYITDHNIQRGKSKNGDPDKNRTARRIEKTMRKREFPGSENPEWYATVIYALRSDEEQNE